MCFHFLMRGFLLTECKNVHKRTKSFAQRVRALQRAKGDPLEASSWSDTSAMMPWQGRQRSNGPPACPSPTGDPRPWGHTPRGSKSTNPLTLGVGTVMVRSQPELMRVLTAPMTSHGPKAVAWVCPQWKLSLVCQGLFPQISFHNPWQPLAV